MNWLTHPIDWWITPFADNPFMQDALWAALLAVVCTSTIGTWVVLRGLSFLGDALAHGVLPGIAIAFVMGTNTTVGALLAALAMVGGVQLIRSASPLPDDASIGVLFVGFLALGGRRDVGPERTGAGDLTRFLFGSITAVDNGNLRTLVVVASITIVSVVIMHRALLVGTFDVTQARLIGFRPQLTHFVAVGVVGTVDRRLVRDSGQLARVRVPDRSPGSRFTVRVAGAADDAVGRRDRIGVSGGRATGQLSPVDGDRRHDGTDDGDRVRTRPRRSRGVRQRQQLNVTRRTSERRRTSRSCARPSSRPGVRRRTGSLRSA